MNERIIQLEHINPIELFGVEDMYLTRIQQLFPKIKIIARGNYMKIIGEADELDLFESRFELLLVHWEHFGSISNKVIDQIMGGEPESHELRVLMDKEVLVYGRSGMQVKAITPNQKHIVSAIASDDMVFAIGPAGTGKTYTAVALAVRALKNKEVRRIILTRPAVEAGENLGFLPGDMKNKLDPYMQPLYDALRDMLPTQKLLSYLEDGTIEVAPLAFMRGRTLDYSFVILDEAQNATPNQLKMFLTRMGRESKFIINGDITQIDLPAKQPSGLIHALQILHQVKGIAWVMLDEKDVVRHKLVTRIIRAYSTQKRYPQEDSPETKAVDTTSSDTTTNTDPNE
ncbi:MAG: PhoH family protein [Bacteroidales bacterium]|jgi:phosphate starvation-inducible PhoH-like protein|nr:PhoH family protein [Bacteroidales bacterium]MDY0369672.1 PhoH family protein [Bacteroidales bacterium]